MKRGWLPGDGANRWLEPLLAIFVFANMIYALVHLTVDDYLPQPFFFTAWDVWMDWFNTAYWSHAPGAYDTWRTLYPPASFIFLRYTTLAHCYIGNEGTFTRDCDWLGLLVLHGFYVLNIFLVSKVFLKIDRRTALWRALAIAAGMPLLDALERGNLILVAFTCFLLAHGPLLRSARLRWFFLGVAINFKVYLIPTLFAYLLRRRWRWFEGATIAMVAVYVVTWGMMGVGTPMEVVENLASWSAQLDASTTLLDPWYATTYQPMIGLLESSAFPIMSFLGSTRLELLLFIIPAALHITQLSILMAAAATWLRPEAVPMYRVVNLCGCLAMITSEPGAYAQMLIIFLTFFERWRGIGVKVAILCCYVLSVPNDIFISPMYPLPNPGWLNKGPLFMEYWIAAGQFIRPMIVLMIPFSLACVTLKDVWRDVRVQGWKDRFRFRHDVPLLVDGGRPPRGAAATA